MKRREERDREIELEIQGHLEAESAELMEQGLSPEQARLTALRAFGNRTICEEQMRQNWIHLRADKWSRDLRMALRALARQPAFFLLTAATLALGIGATSAVFALVYAVLVKPLPFPNPQRVVLLQSQLVHDRNSRQLASPGQYEAWTRETSCFEQTGAYTKALFNAGGDGEQAERIPGILASGSLLSILGARVTQGQVYDDAEATSGAGVALVSDGFWKRRFGGARLSGQRILLHERPHVVLGVLAPDFLFPSAKFDVILPLPRLTNASADTRQRARYLTVLGRLRPEVTWEQAHQQLDGVSLRLAQQYPETDRERTVAIERLDQVLLGPARSRLWLASIAVGGLLLIACLNVASLYLARSVGRRREIAVQIALGAGRGDLFRRLFLEAAVVSLAGAVAGLAVAKAALALILNYAPDNIPRIGEAVIGSPVAVFAILAAIVSALAISAVPLRQMRNVDGIDGLREGGKGAAGESSATFARGVLLGGEVALSTFLVLAAATALTGLSQLLNTDPGFRSSGAVSWDFSLTRRYATDEQRGVFLKQLVDEVSSIPGVEAAAVTNRLPLSGDNSTRPVYIGESMSGVQPQLVEVRRVSPRFFQAMGMRLVAGRMPQEQDAGRAAHNALVNESFVRRFLSGVQPIGQRIFLQDGPNPHASEITGVVNDVRHTGLASQPQPEVYVSAYAQSYPNMTLVIRASDRYVESTVIPGVRRALAMLDSSIPLAPAVPLDQLVSHASAVERLITFLVTVFSLLAALIGMVGINGVTAFAVARRMPEFGIRIALGAKPGNIVSLVLGWTLRIVAIGVLFGVAAAWLVREAGRAFLMMKISWTDQIVIHVAAICLLMATAVVASLAPAIRAASIAPATAQRR